MVKEALASVEQNSIHGSLDKLEMAAHFTSKSMSLMQVIQEQVAASPHSSEDEVLANDLKAFRGLTEEVSQLLKQRMVEAIQNEDEVAIQKIADLFKSVNEQEEGMRHYTNYILQVKTQKNLDTIIQAMYEDTNEASNLSESYAQINQVILECINQYCESILQLFDLNSLIAFLRHIDKVAKEKGTQVIQHFLITNQVEQTFTELINADLPLDELKQQQCDYLCEEISNFSFLYQTYNHFICHLVHRQTKNEKTMRQLQKDLQFSAIDELLGQYLQLEKIYVCNAFADGVAKEQESFIELCEKETQIEKHVLEGITTSDAAQASLEALKDEYSADLIDILCLILDKSIRRALSTLSM